MNETSMNYQLAIQNTKEAIEHARASGNTHEADFLSYKTLPSWRNWWLRLVWIRCRK